MSARDFGVDAWAAPRRNRTLAAIVDMLTDENWHTLVSAIEYGAPVTISVDRAASGDECCLTEDLGAVVFVIPAGAS